MSQVREKIISGVLYLQHDSRNYAAMSLVLHYMSGGTYAPLSPTKRVKLPTTLASIKIVNQVLASTLL